MPLSVRCLPLLPRGALGPSPAVSASAGFPALPFRGYEQALAGLAGLAGRRTRGVRVIRCPSAGCMASGPLVTHDCCCTVQLSTYRLLTNLDAFASSSSLETTTPCATTQHASHPPSPSPFVPPCTSSNGSRTSPPPSLASFSTITPPSYQDETPTLTSSFHQLNLNPQLPIEKATARRRSQALVISATAERPRYAIQLGFTPIQQSTRRSVPFVCFAALAACCAVHTPLAILRTLTNPSV